MPETDDQGQPTEYDSPWKEILKAYFKDFLAFFLPDAHNGIDWQHDPEFLDKELDRITKEAQAKNRLCSVFLGSPREPLFHKHS
ncbi:MAG: hypothetical protein H7837_02130 [Magnetococcus sp. MYC-9]